MRFVMKNEGDEQILTNGKQLTVNKWHHIAITLQPQGDKVEATLYVNGEAVATSNTFTIKPSDIAPSLCYIGRSMFTSDPFFQGRIDDFRIYNHALSASEVAAIMTDTDAVSEDMQDTYEDVTAIIDVPETSTEADGQPYTLDGRQAQDSDKGILIKNGHKYIKK
jgi:hypothetical protein